MEATTPLPELQGLAWLSLWGVKEAVALSPLHFASLGPGEEEDVVAWSQPCFTGSGPGGGGRR